MRVVVLASGNGSNLRALLATRSGGPTHTPAPNETAPPQNPTGRADIIGVISDNPGAPALRFASEQGIPTAVVPYTGKEKRPHWNANLCEAISAFRPDIIVLAGFMRILAPEVIRAFPHRIINVHPSLLPSFKGIDAPAQALKAGVHITGCTVHIVDEGVDSGPILAQAAVAVRRNDTVASLHARIQREEHTVLPKVVNAIANKSLILSPEPVWKDDG